MTEIRLFTPGPTPVPERVRKATALPMIHHRSPEFAAILTSVRTRLKSLCDCDGEVVLFPSSGTGGMEATVGSLFSPGEEVVVVEGGRFGERWTELAHHFKLSVKVVSVEWGKSARVEEVMKALTPKTRGILMQGAESSTGAYHPLSQMGEVLRGRNDILWVVDAITTLGVHDVSMQRDRIDALIGASQKALMSPPGLSCVGLSPRALEKLEKSSSQNFYFSLQREVRMQAKGEAGFTPAISLVRGLHAALGMMEEEGKEKIFARHRKMQQMARAALREDGLKLFNRDEEATWGITVVEAPEGTDLKTWLNTLKQKEGLWLAGGQGKLSEKIFRLSHMGAVTPVELLSAIETIEGSLASTYPQAAKHSGYRKAKLLL